MVDLDYKKIIKESKDLDSLVLTMRVEFPKHYGVAETDKNNYIKSIEEKPENPKSNRAVIGAYYFKSLQKVKKILDDLYDKKETIKGEYKIAQVNEIFVRAGDLKIKAFDVDKWFDCGRPEVLLDANKYFLELLSERKSKFRGDSLIVPPSYIAKDAVIENSIVGPNVSIGSGAYIRDSCIKNSIIGPGARIENLVLKDSLVGKEASMKGKATRINMSEKSELSFFE